MRSFVLGFLFLVTCCGNPSQQTATENKTPASTKPTSAYTESLQRLPVNETTSREGLLLFVRFKSSPPSNDTLLMEYLVFQATLIDTLNNRLIKNPDYSKIESLIWADDSLHEQEGKDYLYLLEQNYLTLRSTEGTIYIDRLIEPIQEAFRGALTPATQSFLEQYAVEHNRVASEDAMLIIDTNEVADRLGFWDAFLQHHPDNLFADIARSNARFYLRTLLQGMNNSPAFDFDSHQLDDATKNGMVWFLQKFPNATASAGVAKYKALIESNNNLESEAVTAFADSLYESSYLQ